MKTYLSCLFITLILSNCTKTNGVSTKDNTPVLETSLTLNDKLMEDENFQSFPQIPTQNLPFIDSTNFDNYQDEDGIKNDLFIQEIGFHKITPGAENIRLRYRLRFSDQFYSAVITYRRGEHELFTVLVNINENKKMIDHDEIAYDEIAESAFKKISTINRNKITVEDWNYMSEVPIKKTTFSQISKEGKFNTLSY